ncbi:unnamed protein product [Moneuplotes crassus]|uniref:SWIM-type domain-containing protein n=1 Tax=Euplotes crassus TaxID=5936 RepID=A0AAD2DAV5_EUPCR|nr:unnamed protein product [Moneuplotes crassus]
MALRSLENLPCEIAREDDGELIDKRLQSSSEDSDDDSDMPKKKHKKKKRDQKYKRKSLNSTLIEKAKKARKWRRVNAAISSATKFSTKTYTFSEKSPNGHRLPVAHTQTFPDIGDLYLTIQKYSDDLGFEIKFDKKDKSIICTRGGGIRVATVKKGKLQVEESEEMTGCPFKITVKQNNTGEWIARSVTNQHNHLMKKEAQPEFGEDVQKIISKFRGDLGAHISINVKNQANISYFKHGLEMAEVIRECKEKYKEEKTDEQEIIDYIVDLKKLPPDNLDLVTNLAKYCIEKQKEFPSLDFKVRKDLRYICWTLVKKERRGVIGDAIIIDTTMTPELNGSCWYMVIFQAINEYGIIEPIFICLCSNINYKKIVSMMISYRQLGFDKPFSVICDDEDHILTAIRDELKIGKFKHDPRLLICKDHMFYSLRKRLEKCKDLDPQKIPEVCSEIDKIINIPTKARYKQRFKNYIYKFDAMPKARKVIKRYFKHKKYFNEILHFKGLNIWKSKQKGIFEKKIEVVDEKAFRKFDFTPEAEIPLHLAHYKNRYRAYGYYDTEVPVYRSFCASAKQSLLNIRFLKRCLYTNHKILDNLLDTHTKIHLDIQCRKTFLDGYPNSTDIIETIRRISQTKIRIKRKDEHVNIYIAEIIKDAELPKDLPENLLYHLYCFNTDKVYIPQTLIEALYIDLDQSHELEIREDRTLSCTCGSFYKIGFLCIHMFALLDYLDLDLMNNLNMVRDCWLKKVPTVKGLDYQFKTIMRYFNK